MKKSIMFVTTVAISALGTLHAEIIIQNNYKSPIIVNINGYDSNLLQTGASFSLPDWTEYIKIRTDRKGSLYDSGIQKEFMEIQKAKQQYNVPDIFAIIKILPSNNIFSFKYETIAGDKEFLQQHLQQQQQQQVPFKVVLVNETGQQISFQGILTNGASYGTGRQDAGAWIDLYDSTNPMLFKLVQCTLNGKTTNITDEINRQIQNIDKQKKQNHGTYFLTLKPSGYIEYTKWIGAK